MPDYKAGTAGIGGLRRLTPSAMNQQPLKYYFGMGEGGGRGHSGTTKWAGALRQVTLPHEGHYPPAFIVMPGCFQINASEAFLKDVGSSHRPCCLRRPKRDLAAV